MINKINETDFENAKQDILPSLRVLVTRPSPSGEELCQRIRLAGGEATHFPTIAIAPPQDGRAFQHAIEQIDSQDWLIFISPQAVYASVRDIRDRWPQLPLNVHIAAIGAGTAHALEETGYRVNAQPTVGWNSEHLLALPVFQAITHQRITLVRGEGGRETLVDTLIARGATVSHAVAYQRVLPVLSEREITACRQLFERNQIDVVVCTSGEGVRYLKILLGERCWPSIKKISLLVVSERIKRLAEDLDFQTIWVAQNASHEVILTALLQR